MDDVHVDLARLAGAVAGGDHPLVLHHLDDAGGAVVADAQAALDHGDAGLLGLGHQPQGILPALVLLLVILVIALIPAIVEEVLFRGLVQRSFEIGLGRLRGVLLTGIIFGAYHLNPFSLIPLIALGVYLGFLAMRANSLWVSIAAHFYNNAAACIAIFLQQDDDAIVTGNPNQMSLAMLLGTFWFFGVIFLLSTYYFVHITKPKQEMQITET